MATLVGDNNRNELYGTKYRDWIYGYGGDDSIFGMGGNDYLYGGDGRDYINGGTGNDIMIGGDGGDSYIVDSPYDYVFENAGEGRDSVHSTVDISSLFANVESLYLSGSATVGVGNDLGNFITANQFKDTSLYGEGGVDYIYGWNGNDYLDGGEGNDTLYGKNGNDVLIGGAGKDNLFGGSGRDTFVLEAGSYFDVIWDYSSYDNIVLPKGYSLKLFYGEYGGDTIYDYSPLDTYIYGDNGSTVDLLAIVVDQTLHYDDFLSGFSL